MKKAISCSSINIIDATNLGSTFMVLFLILPRIWEKAWWSTWFGAKPELFTGPLLAGHIVQLVTQLYNCQSYLSLWVVYDNPGYIYNITKPRLTRFPPFIVRRYFCSQVSEIHEKITYLPSHLKLQEHKRIQTERSFEVAVCRTSHSVHTKQLGRGAGDVSLRKCRKWDCL